MEKRQLLDTRPISLEQLERESSGPTSSNTETDRGSASGVNKQDDKESCGIYMPSDTTNLAGEDTGVKVNDDDLLLHQFEPELPAGEVVAGLPWLPCDVVNPETDQPGAMSRTNQENTLQPRVNQNDKDTRTRSQNSQTSTEGSQTQPRHSQTSTCDSQTLPDNNPTSTGNKQTLSDNNRTLANNNQASTDNTQTSIDNSQTKPKSGQTIPHDSPISSHNSQTAPTRRRNPFVRTNYGAIPHGTSTTAAASIQQITAASLDGESYRSEDGVDGTHPGLDEVTLLQACVFLEDALEYRSIHHRVDKKSLLLYRIYYSKPIQWLLYVVLFTLHILAFFEYPSSLTVTSDIRYREPRVEVPCGVTEAIEILCLLILVSDLVCKSYLKGKDQFLRSKWLWACSAVLLISIIDWNISVGLQCSETIRVRRMLRPFFLLQNSSLMKKTVNCLRKTMPHVVSVLLLLFLHLYFFTLFGMLLFPKEMGHHSSKHRTDNSSEVPDDERIEYFQDPVEAFLSLLVLLTTANNPDVTMPAYSSNRLYAIFFIVYLVIGLYCLMNMLTAVIYNQFRGYFTDSIQASLFRRRLGVKAMYEVLRKSPQSFRYSSSFAALSQGVPLQYIQQVLREAKIPRKYRPGIDKEFSELPGRLLDYHQVQTVFGILDTDVSKKSRPQIPAKTGRWRCFQSVIVHQYFNYVGCLVAGINVLCITLELGLDYENVRKSRNTYIGILNLLFVVYFWVEQSLKIWGLGWVRYSWDIGNLMDGFITILLVLAQGIYVAVYGIPFWGKGPVSDRGLSLWDLVRIINILIMIRLLRMIISQIQAMSIVSSTLIDLVKNLRAFAGILIVIFYSYALLGMELFQGVLRYDNTTDSSNHTERCGTYRQLQYWANNFDDFGAALVLLWDIMVVNNWHVFLQVYKEATTGWSQIYFIVWWLLSVVISLNLFTALILENFIMRWDRQQQVQNPRSREDSTLLLEDSEATPNQFTVHDMFRSGLQEPSQEALTVELRQHPYFDD